MRTIVVLRFCNRVLVAALSLVVFLMHWPASADVRYPPCASAEACLKQLATSKEPGGLQMRTSSGMLLDTPLVWIANRVLRLGGVKMVLPMASLLSSPRPYVAAAAAIALGNLGPKASAAFPALVRALAHPMRNGESFAVPGADDINPGVAMALVQIDRERARVHLKQALRRGRVTAAEALFTLGSRGTDTIREVLADSGHAATALHAVATLLFYPEAENVATKIAPFKDELDILATNEKLGAETRKEAAALLVHLTPPSAVLLSLASRWATSPTETLREEATNLQSKLGDPRALARLLREPIEGESSPWLYFESYQLVAEYGEKADAAVPRLIELLEGQQSPTAVFAAWTLGKIPTESSRKALIKSLDSWNWMVAIVAANSLGQLGTRAALARQQLERLAKAHWHPGVRAQAASALEAALGRAKPVEPTPYYRINQLELGHEMLSDDWVCEGVRLWQDVTPLAPTDSEAPAPKPVHKVSDGWLVVTNTPDFEPEQLRFTTALGQEGNIIATGRFPAIVGTSNEAFVLESKKRSPFWSRLLRIRRASGKWLAESFVELPIGAKPRGRAPDGALILRSNWGDVRIDTNGNVVTGSCIERYPAATGLGHELVQRLLDDRRFHDLLTKRKAPIPLPLSWQHHDSAGLVFEGKPVHVVDNVLGPDLGRELRVSRVEMDATTAGSVTFAYWDLGIEGSATFEKGSSGWHVEELEFRHP
jgi:HEAT repeat protein